MSAFGVDLVLDESALTEGEMLGEGGTAAVFALHDHDRIVWKKYQAGLVVDAEALDRLITWRRSLGPEDQAMIDQRTSWPLARVTDRSGRTTGVLLPRAPDQFLIPVATGGSRLCELQYLFLRRAETQLGIAVPAEPARLRLVADLAEVLALFRRHNLVHGDLSHKNILWTESPHCGVYLLDCDGVRVPPHSGAVPHVTTLHWTDTRLLRGEIREPDADSDVFCLAISLFRVYFRVPGSIGETDRQIVLPPFPPLPARTGALIGASLGNRLPRPSPDEWVTHLRALAEELVDPGSSLHRELAAGTDRSPATVPVPDAPALQAGRHPTQSGGGAHGVPSRRSIPPPPGRRLAASPGGRPPTPIRPPGGGVADRRRLGPMLLALVLGLALGATVALIALVLLAQ